MNADQFSINAVTLPQILNKYIFNRPSLPLLQLLPLLLTLPLLQLLPLQPPLPPLQLLPPLPLLQQLPLLPPQPTKAAAACRSLAVAQTAQFLYPSPALPLLRILLKRPTTHRALFIYKYICIFLSLLLKFLLSICITFASAVRLHQPLCPTRRSR